MGPLDGIRVVDLSTHLSGPYCTMHLADLGADVVKVERPGGEVVRLAPPVLDGRSAAFDLWNRNKRGIVLDAHDPADRAVLQALIARADVLVENFRPGTLARIGLPPEELEAANPRLIIASITGYGTEGPLAANGALDLMGQAMGGLMEANAAAEDAPRRLPIAAADLTAGMQCCLGVLAALHARHATGRGQRVEVSLLGSALSLGVYQAAHLLALGTPPPRRGNAHPAGSPYQAFRAADGWLTLAAIGPQAWSSFCAILDLMSLIDDPRFATNADRVANNDALAALVAPVIAGRSRDEWLALFEAVGIPAAPVLSHAEALAHPQAAGLVADLPGEGGGLRRTLAPPIRLSDTPASVRRRAPALDEHGEEIRAELDL